MAKSGQNSIQTMVLELAYGGKTAAMRGSSLIESIFKTDLLPEIENAIAKEIPKGALLELAKLEINIGTINENQLEEQLAGRIKTALGEALHNTTNISKNLASRSSDTTGLKDDSFLLEALELYLLQGYFPLWVDPSETMVDIMTKLLSDYPDQLVQLLRKLGKYDTVAQRLAYGLNLKRFNTLLKALQPVDAVWINAFEHVLLKIWKSKGSSRGSSKDFIQKVHFFILKNILNTTSVDFNRTQFLNNILHEIAGLFHLETEAVVQHLKQEVITDHSNSVLKASLEMLVFSKKSVDRDTVGNELPIEQLLRFLNSPIFMHKNASTAHLKIRILEVLRDRDERTVLYDGLNEAGAIRVLQLGYPKMAGGYLEIIKSFSRWVSQRKHTPVLKKYVEATIRYLTESAVRPLDKEEYIYFLVNATESQGFLKTDGFKSFMREHKQVDLEKFHELVRNEEAGTEIAGLWQLLSKSTKGKRAEPNYTQEFLLIYSRKIVAQFLKEGHLQESYFDLTQKDVSWLFRQLLKRRDSYLLNQLRRLVDTTWMVDRLDALCTIGSLTSSEDAFLPATLINGNKKTEAYLKQLYTFTPGQTVADQYKRLYNQQLWRFVVLSFLDKKQYTAKTFAVTFGSELHKVFRKYNALGVLELMMGQMLASGSSELKTLASLWARTAHKKSRSHHRESTFIGAFEADSPTKDTSFYLSILQFFARNGFFPWWSGTPTFGDLMNELGKLGQKNAKILEDKLVQLEEKEALVELLIPKLSSSEINALGRMLPELSPLLISFKNGTRKSNNLKAEETLFKSLYFLEDDQILERWGTNNPDAIKQALTYTSLSPYFHFKKLSPIRWRQMVYEFTLAFYDEGQPTISDHYDRELLNYLKKNHHQMDWEDVLSSVQQRIANTDGHTSGIFPKSMAKIIKSIAAKPKKDNDENTGMLEQSDIPNNTMDIKVSNAGLILFWPFLTRFFEHLSLLKDGRFIDDNCRNEAVYLLQYLAYNEIDFPEHQLVLNKVLVGIPPHEIVLPLSRLSEGAKHMAQSLLNGLIGNWEKLKDSSPEAIQETFLQREGLLSIREESLLLKIDKKGVDVLLTSIPWNITLVKLPWMKKPLHVAWA